MSDQIKSFANLDSLLDASLDDIADLPEFKVFPEGAYRLLLKWEEKEINKQAAVEFKFKLLEVLELGDAAVEAPAPESETSVAFMLGKEFGLGNLKRVVTPIAQAIGATGMRQTLEALQSAEVVGVLKTRQNKEKTATYQEIVSISLV